MSLMAFHTYIWETAEGTTEIPSSLAEGSQP